jgi:hypothetical protein
MPKGCCKGNGGRPWTAEEVARLTQAHAEGKTYKVIAHEMGRSLVSITDKIRRLHLVREKSRAGGNDVFNPDVPIDLRQIALEREKNLVANERFQAAMRRAYGVEPSKPSKFLKKTYARTAHISGYVPGASSLE